MTSAYDQCKHTRRTGAMTMRRCELVAVRDGYCTRHHHSYVPPSMKVHLHDEQFDGWLHAACGGLDAAGPRNTFIEPEDEFIKLPRKVLCDKCVKHAFPHGYEPPAITIDTR